jgi:hypothetical protein
MAEQIVRIQSLPGIKRDGTKLEGDNYIDGAWVRFDRGLPRKMWGYASINKYLIGLARSIFGYTRDGLTYVHAGSSARLERLYIDENGNTSIVSDRTPAGLTASADNLWQFDSETLTSGTIVLMAQVAPNLSHISNNAGGQIFYGTMTATATLTQLTTGGGGLPTGVSVTGGVVAVHPYTFLYGNDGYVAWSVAGNPIDYTSTGSGAANITGQKIVKGLPIRGGGGNSPAALFWSLDSLIRASFVGGTTVFQFDTITSQSSILSAASVIEYDGIYYWIGIDRFLSFNGVVREIPNPVNKNFFFDNINLSQRQKVFATKVPRFGEIWFCFPFGDATEPNWAIVFQPATGTWYDTPLPEDGRAAGIPAAVFPSPIMSGVRARNYIATAAAVAAGGAGYTAGDVLHVSGGSALVPVELTVTTVAAGAVTVVAISNAGEYVSTPANAVSVTGGTGSGATFNLAFVTPYNLWVHETGLDAVDGQVSQPIQSYFETADISIPVTQHVEKSTQVLIMEPDFVQTGDMTVQVRGRANARSPENNGEVKTFVAPPVPTDNPQAQLVYFKDQRRQLRFRFESNTPGGDYQMGLILAHIQPSDGTVVG